MHSERITFAGAGGADLAARLDLPDGPTRAVALFAHCFTCSKDIPAARRIAGRLAAAGIAVLRFDFTGLGHSDGEFANTHFSSNVEDLLAAAAYLDGRGMAPSLLIGHSLGGAAVLKAAGRIDSARAVVTIGAPFDPGHVTHNFAGSLDDIARDGAAQVDLGGRPFTIRQSFVDDVSAQELAPAISHLKRALLVLHAPRDTVVGIDNATSIFTAAKHPKSFVSLDDADHLVTRPDDAEYAAGVIAAWAARYLDLGLPAHEDPPEGVVRVSEAASDGYLQDIAAGRHALSADEPVSVGGTDRGPTPYDLMAAALGACTTMTLRMYARHKGLEMGRVRVDVTHARTHASDAAPEDGDPPSPQVDLFTRTIALPGGLDPDTRQRLLEIADKCPVHRTLSRVSKIDTRLA